MSLTEYLRAAESRLAPAKMAPGAARVRLGLVVFFHLAAIAVMAWTEVGPFGLAMYLLTWAFLNFFWLAVLGRPAIAAFISLTLIVILIQLSNYKFEITWMTITFLDVLIIDPDTFSFLLSVSPKARLGVMIGVAVVVPLLILIWRSDPFRARRHVSTLGAAGCATIIAGLSIAVPEHGSEPFRGSNHVSGFMRSAFTSAFQLSTQGWLESDLEVTERLRSGPGVCAPAQKPPHIVLVLDESSFDVTAASNINVPQGYEDHFRSLDGKKRLFSVETTGGPTWYSEYNVLTGLSAKSFGKLMFYVTRIAAGHVKRGLPHTLRNCGYKTFTLYPAYGAFLNARRFQTSAGVQKLIDQDEMKAGDPEPDQFFYNQAAKIIGREGSASPLFLFVYTAANHFPWDDTFRPDLTPGWKNPGNTAEIDEYLRRQMMSAADYVAFKERLAREFPDESFLIVRFGDHQPFISAKFLEPGRDISEIARHIMNGDPRYFTTYYAIDGVNFTPADLTLANDTLDAPYLPLVVLEAAGLPLDPSFAEQKQIMLRCKGLFFGCDKGAEARRFNRLLIDAGLITGL